MKAKFLTTTFAVLGTIVSGHAALITGVTVDNVSTENGGFNRLAVNSVNGSGLSAGSPPSHIANPGGTMWMANEIAPDITYDLGAIYPVNSFRVWNYNEGYNNGGFTLTDRGLQDVEITYGTTPALGSTLGGVTSFAEASGLDSYTGEEFTFSTIDARYIRINASSNYGSPDQSGLSEIQFSIPEPSSAAILGLGAFALILRRRK